MEEGPGGEAIEAVVGVDEGCGKELPATGGVQVLYDLLVVNETHMILLHTMYRGKVVVGGKISKADTLSMSERCFSECGVRNFFEYTVASLQ